jgi:hypothetical protein
MWRRNRSPRLSEHEHDAAGEKHDNGQFHRSPLAVFYPQQHLGAQQAQCYRLGAIIANIAVVARGVNVPACRACRRVPELALQFVIHAPAGDAAAGTALARGN